MTKATTLDTRGRRCPVPILMLTRKIKELAPGDLIEVLADDSEFAGDVRSWCQYSGNTLLSLDSLADHYVARIERKRG